MTADGNRILMASRPYEAPPTEGGLHLQRDVARHLARFPEVEVSIFSSSSGVTSEGVRLLKVYRRPMWGATDQLRFLYGLLRHAPGFATVHTAHVPTRRNVRLIGPLAARGRRRGTRFVQTMVALPTTDPEELRRLAWGDVIITQSRSAQDALRSVGVESSVITPWPAPDRVAFDPDRRDRNRSRLFDGRPLVVFPGEFERLGIDERLQEAIPPLVEAVPDTLFVLACRYDTDGIARRIEAAFPRSVRSLGLVEGGIRDVLEAADVVYFPARTMAGKFQPPMVLLESLSLGSPVVASERTDLPDEVEGLVTSVDSTAPWVEQGQMLASVLQSPPERAPFAPPFEQTVDAYREVLGSS